MSEGPDLSATWEAGSDESGEPAAEGESGEPAAEGPDQPGQRRAFDPQEGTDDDDNPEEGPFLNRTFLWSLYRIVILTRRPNRRPYLGAA